MIFFFTEFVFNGNKWNRLYNSLGDGTVQSIISNGSNLFACSRGNGVFWANTNSKTWVNTGISDFKNEERLQHLSMLPNQPVSIQLS